MTSSEKETASVFHEPQSPQYTLTLGGSWFSIAMYGFVQFLRPRRWARGTCGVMGVALFLVAAVDYAGWNIIKGPVNFMLFFLGTGLLCLATLSGREFSLTFPTSEASREREEAESKFDDSKDPIDALSVDSTRLNEYYVINQTQARSSFRWAVFSILLGFSTIIAGIWVFYFSKSPSPDVFMASLTSSAGIVVDLLGALFLYLHNQTQKRALFYYQQLTRVQRVAMAIRLAESISEESDRKAAKGKVIEYLLSESHLRVSPDQEAEG